MKTRPYTLKKLLFCCLSLLVFQTSYAQFTDNCTGAILLTGDYTNRALTIPAGQTASASPPICSFPLKTVGSIVQDSWLKVRAATTGLMVVSFTPTTPQDIVLAVYSDNCGTLPLLQCTNRFTGVSAPPSVTYTAVASKNTESAVISAIAGTDYLVRIINQSTAGSYSGNMSIYTGPAPQRDLCISSAPVSIGTCNFSFDVSANHVHNESLLGVSVCGTVPKQDSWARIALTAGMSIRIRYTNANKDASLGIYSGDCGNLTFLSCQDDVPGIGTESIEFEAPTTGTYYIRVMNKIDENTMTGSMCIDEVAYRDDASDVTSGTFPSPIRVGSCGVRVAIDILNDDALNPITSCNTAPDNLNVWLKYIPAASDVGKYLRAEFTGNQNIGIGITKNGIPGTSVAGTCVMASASNFAATNFVVEASTTYYIQLSSETNTTDILGSFCLYEDVTRSEDFFYTSRIFLTNGADCGKIFNIYNTFENDGGEPVTLGVGGVGSAINAPSCASPISRNDAWGNFQVSGAIPAGGYKVEYNNDDNNNFTTASNVAMQVFKGGALQSASAVTYDTYALACAGTSINTNMVLTGVNVNTAINGTITPGPTCLGTIPPPFVPASTPYVENRDVWVKYTSTGTGNFRVIFRNNGVETGFQNYLVQVYAGGTCAALGTAVGCSRKISTSGVAEVLVTNTAAGVVYHIRIVSLDSGASAYTITGELSVNDPAQLQVISCSNVVVEGTESITLNTGAPALFTTGSQYYFRIGNVESGSRTIQGTVCIRNNSIPAGDLCSNALQLIVSDCDITFNLTSAFTNNQILADASSGTIVPPAAAPPTCPLPAANAWRDGWISFTATSSVTAVEYTQANSTTEDTQIEIFRGSCGSLIRVAALGTNNFCVNEVPVATAGEERYQFASIAGVVYYARIINRFANTMAGKVCIYNVTERDICDDDDLDTRYVGDCNLFVDVPLTFDNDLHPDAIEPNLRDFTTALPVTEIGGSLPQTTTSSCEVPFSTTLNGNQKTTNTDTRDAWVRFIGNGNDATIIYQTITNGGGGEANPAIAIYTALKSVGPVNCGTGLSGANNPENQYACANNTLTNTIQTESVTFKTNGGQQYLLRIMNLNGSVGMKGLLCISDGRNDYNSPCTSAATPPRAVDIGKCSVPLNVIGRTTPNCFDPANSDPDYNAAGACDNCISSESWAVVTRPYICDSSLTPPSPNTGGGSISCAFPYRVNLGSNNAIGGTGAAADKCECGLSATNNCGTGAIPAPLVLNNTNGVCPFPYSYDNRGTGGTGDDRCVCSQQTIRNVASSGSFTISYDNRNGTSAVAPDANMVIYTTTNCNDENAYTRVGGAGNCIGVGGTPAPQNVVTGEAIRSHTITGLSTAHGSGGESYLVRILNQSNTGQTLFGTLCTFYGSSLGGGVDCPATTNNDYGDLEGDFTNMDVPGGGSPPAGADKPTTTITGCAVPGGSNPVSNGTNPIRSDSWIKFVVPANVTYSKVTVQYDNSGYSTTRNAAIAVYTAPAHPAGANGAPDPNCDTYDLTTNPDGLFLLDCVNTVFSGSESVTVPITFSGGTQPSTTPTSIARTYYVRVMNVHNEDTPGTLNGRIRIFPYADCNLGSELAYDGDFERWPAVNYAPGGGFPNNQTETTANFDTKMNAAIFTIPEVTSNDPYPNDLDGVFGSAVNTGVAQYATDYGFVRDGALPSTSSLIAVAERPYKHTYAESVSSGNQYELGPEGLYLIRQTAFTVHQAFKSYGAGYSGYGNSGHTSSSDSYCATGGGGANNEPCVSISLGSTGYTTIGAYRATNGLGDGRPAAVPASGDANYMIVNGSYNPSGTLPPGKIWCQTIQRDVNDWDDVSYYVFSIWSQNLIQAGWNLDVPQLRLTVCDMENPADGTLPTIRDIYNTTNGDANENETRMTRLPGITDMGLLPSLRSGTNPSGLFEEELALPNPKQQVRHLPRPGNNRIFALVSNGTRPPSYGAAMHCSLTENNGWTGAENVNEASNARLKVLGSSFLIPESPDNWFAIRCIYRAPRNVREMNICIENLSLTQNGNDLAVDKISFRKCEGADAEVFDKLLKGDPCELSNDGKNIGIPLPARLIEFSGELLGDRVALNWLVINELTAETSHYQIQRSTDGNTFSPIGTIDARGTMDNYQQYVHTDFNLPQGVKVIYYRLNIIDKRGLEHLGSIVAVKIEGQENFNLKLIPNPTEKGSEIQMAFYSVLAGKASVEVADLTGARMMTKIHQAQVGENALALDTRGLKAGLYIVRLVLNGKVATQKLIIK